MIIPAILENSFEGVCLQLEKYQHFARRVQIDLVKWKPNGDEDMPFWDVYDFEYDLLNCSNVDTLEKIKNIGAGLAVIHIDENTNVQELYEYCKQYDIKMGISGDVDLIIKNIDNCDYVQLMGISNVGFQRQPFREGVIDDIKKIKSITDKVIQIDGSINEETIKLCSDAGATNFAVGSYFKNADDVQFAYKKLKNIVNS